MELATASLASPSLPTRPSALDHVARMLHAGKVYRREDLAQVSNAVDRHLRELVSGGTLKRLAQGLETDQESRQFLVWELTRRQPGWSYA